jgi:hypothetical protein
MTVYTMHNTKRVRKDAKPRPRSKECRWVERNVPIGRYGKVPRKYSLLDFVRYWRWYTQSNRKILAWGER